MQMIRDFENNQVFIDQINCYIQVGMAQMYQSIFQTYNHLLHTKMDTNTEIELKETGSRSPPLKVKINELTFLGCGSEHAVFEVKNKNGLVLIFLRDHLIPEQETSQIEEQAQSTYQQVYESMLNSLFPALKMHRCEKQVLHISNQNGEFQIICQLLEEKVKGSSDQLYVPDRQNFKISRNHRKVYLTQNIFDQKYNTIVEFKPYTVIPEAYPRQTLETVGKEFGKKTQEVIELLKSADPIEKLRWFKVYELLKKDRASRMNPMEIFNADHANRVPKFTSSKYFKKFPPGSEEHLEQLNNSIFKELQKKKNLMETLLSIYQLFPYSSDLIKSSELHPENVKLENLKSELQNVVKGRLASQPKIPLSQFTTYLKDFSCVAEQTPYKCSPECLMLLYLMARTWRDISIVVLASFDGISFNDFKICIIDDYLRSCRNLVKNTAKDAQVLRMYVQGKVESEEQRK